MEAARKVDTKDSSTQVLSIASSDFQTSNQDFLINTYKKPVDQLCNVLLSGEIQIVHLEGLLFDVLATIESFNISIIWNLRDLKAQGLQELIQNEEAKDQFKYGLCLSTCVLISDNALADLIEKEFQISIAVGLTNDTALSIASAPVLIGVGAGMGNVMETTPMLKTVSQSLGYPIDVYVNSPVPGVESLLGRSPWINMAYGNRVDVGIKNYSRAFITASAGHVIPTIDCKQSFIQRRKFEMMHECKRMHESEFNFLGLSEIFPEVVEPANTWEHFFVRDCEYKHPANKVVGICDGKVPGKWQLREWNQFDELTAQLTKLGYEVRSFGVAHQYVPGSINKTGTTLVETLSNLQECSYFIGSDGGLAHLAEAIGIPTVVLFGPTSIVKNGPIAPWTRAVTSGVECSPCQWKVDFVECRDNVCMTNISIDQVIEALSQLEASHSTSKTPARVFYADALLQETENEMTLCKEEALKHFIDRSFSNYPDSPEFYLKAIQGNLRYGQLERAEIIVNRAIGLYPNSKTIRKIELEFYFQKKDYDTAFSLSSKLLGEYPNDVAINTLHLRVLLKLELWSEATKFTINPVCTAKQTSELAWLIGNAQRELGELNEARQSFLQGLAADPENQRLLGAIETLNDSVFRSPTERSKIANQNTLNIAVVSDSPTKITQEFRPVRSSINLFVFSSNNFRELQDYSEEFNWILTDIPQVSRELPGKERQLVEFVKSDDELAKEVRSWVDRLDIPSNRQQVSDRKYSGKRFVVFAHHHFERWSPHGGEKSMLAIAEYLVSEGAELLVVVSNMKTSDVFCEELSGIKYVVVSKWCFLSVLKEVIAGYLPDLALTWGPQSLKSGPLAKQLGLPYILFVRYWKVVQDLPYDTETLAASPSKEELEKYGPVYQHADAVITNGQYVTDVVDSKYSVKSKVAYVPVAPPPKDYAPPPADKRTLITLVNPRKAQGEYIVRQLAQRLPQYSFNVIGEPSIEMPANVRLDPYFKGHYTDMLAETRVLLFPWGEVPCGTGRVVFEAYYAGVPVVSVNIGGMYEVISNDFLVDHNDNIDGWVEAITKAYKACSDTFCKELYRRASEFPETQGQLLLDHTIESIL